MNCLSDPDSGSDIVGKALVTARRKSGNIALRQLRRFGLPDRTITFGELESLSRRGAAELIRSGIGRGSRILLSLPVGVRFFVGLLSILRTSATAILADFRTMRRSMSSASHPGEASHVVSERPYSLIMRLLAGRGRFPDLIPLERILRRPADFDLPKAGTSAFFPGLISFTTGTTGPAKSVYRDNNRLAALHVSVNEVFLPRSVDVEFCGFPSFVLNNALCGMESVIASPSIISNPRQLIGAIRRLKVNRILISPGPLVKLAEYCHERRISLGGVHTVNTGGAPVHWDKLVRIREVFPEARVVYVYGSSEAQPISSVEINTIGDGRIEAWRRGNGVFVGTPMSMITLEIRSSVLVGMPGLQPSMSGVGEICVSGEHVGRQPDGSQWLHTGDYGYFDEAGGLWLVGRLKHSHRMSRGYLFPYPVEMEVESLPGIRRCGCLLPESGEPVLFLESKSKDIRRFHQEPELVRSVRAIAERRGLDSCRLVFLRTMPVDPRHRYRVDYRMLANINKRAVVSGFLHR